ncbi:hypothetical protein ACFL51_00680 [Myxococcota bacterium]
MSEIDGATLVILARRFNPSITNQLWFVKHRIVNEDDFQGGCVFTDMITHIETTQFSLLISLDRLQLAPRIADTDVADLGELVRDKVDSIVRLLPETPYTAIGMNFVWISQIESGRVPSESRRLFAATGALYDRFGDAEARFGAFLSRAVGPCTLSLDIKPLRDPDAVSNSHLIRFAFNYNHDLSDPVALDSIRDVLGRWTEFYRDSEETMNVVGI